VTVSYPAVGVTVHHGDALAVLRGMDDCSVDAVVTDPPYSLRFMGRAWDSHDSPAEFQTWCQQWATECLRVVRPGGYLASFGGTRTYHRLASGIEDAGWYITDSIGSGLYGWQHGQGFPKGKSQLKPAWEPIIIGRKAAKRVEPLQIDACRVAGKLEGDPHRFAKTDGGSFNAFSDAPPVVRGEGRWPTNLVLAHHPSCVEVGTREVRTGVAVNRNRDGRKPSTVNYVSGNVDPTDVTYGTDGRETITAFSCAPDCHVRALDEQSGNVKGAVSNGKRAGTGYHENFGEQAQVASYGDSGGASRFYPTFRYQAKAPKSERPQVDGRGHPTVKPLALMAWLVRLLTPPGGTVLDCFAGSGSTLQAAHDEGMTAIGVEADEHSVALIHQRFADAAARAPKTPEPELDLFTAAGA
jgi:hypothetical protein